MVCYDSRLVSREEHHYCVTRKELLAVNVVKHLYYLISTVFSGEGT